MVSLFVGCDGRPWTESEVIGRLDALLHVGRWVAGQASRYKIPLTLGVCDTYFAVEDDSTEQVEIGFAPEGDEVGPAELGQITKSLVMMSRAACRLGFRDADEMVETIAGKLPGFRSVWFLHIRALALAGHPSRSHRAQWRESGGSLCARLVSPSPSSKFRAQTGSPSFTNCFIFLARPTTTERH